MEGAPVLTQRGDDVSKVITGNALGMQVLEALGIDANGVRSVQLNMECNQAATATVVVLVKDEEARQIVDLLSVYRIEPAEALGESDGPSMDE